MNQGKPAQGKTRKFHQKSKKPNKSNRTQTVGDTHNRMEIQRQNQRGLTLAIYNKHLLDEGFDCATIRLGPDDIIKLRNECNTALDSELGITREFIWD